MPTLIKFRRKNYNNLLDNGEGVVVFDNLKHQIFIEGVCYSSNVADASFDSTTGVLSITKRDNTTLTVEFPSIDDVLPSQSGNSGKFLKTDGTTASWESLPSATNSTAGITKVGVSDGAAAFGHNHTGVYKPIQTAVSDPTASGTSTTFIDTISQDTNGVISVTKKSIQVSSSLPTPTSSDEGKLISVDSNGNYVLVTIPNAENIAY